MKVLNILVVLVIPFFLFSQNRLEVGFFIGTTEYQGDLAENHIEFGETKLAFGGIMKYKMNKSLNLRGSLYHGFISGDDRNSPHLMSRGFRFAADIYELGVGVEFLPIEFLKNKSRRNNSLKFDAYLFSGVGFTYADAKVTVRNSNSEWLFPEPEDTFYFVNIPVGAGAKVYFTELTTFGIEVGWRTVLSDYLDGVSQNGRPDKNDWYMFGGVTFGLYLDPILERSF